MPAATLHVATDADDHPLGFMGTSEGAIDSLFVDPGHHGRGVGRCLVDMAKGSCRSLTVDVNEQNVGARLFYERLGFIVVGRSDLDGSGMPYPLLHLRSSPQAA